MTSIGYACTYAFSLEFRLFGRLSPPPWSANSTYHIIGQPYTLAHVMLPLLSIFLLTHACTFAHTRTVS